MIVDRPWGRTQTYALNQPATARLVTVVPGGDTGAHYHRLRDELWIVLDGGLTIEIGNRVLEPVPGDELQVPAEEPHRIRCGPDGPGRILQIAFGYASEDDRLPGRRGVRSRCLGSLVDGVVGGPYTARARMRTCVRGAPVRCTVFHEGVMRGFSRSQDQRQDQGGTGAPGRA